MQIYKKLLLCQFSAFTLIELIIAIALIGIIAIGLTVDAPRELFNTEKKDRLGNFIVSEIRTITAENITGRLSETGSGTADKTKLIISSRAITKELLKLDSDGNETVIDSRSSLEAPFFGSAGYQITKICGYYGTGIVLPPANFSPTDTIEITVDSKERKTEMNYSGALNSANGCTPTCALSIIEMQVSYGNHDAKVKYDARTGVSSVIPLSLDSQFCNVQYNSAGYAGSTPTFIWKQSEWSSCDQVCGNGTQSRIYLCMRDDGSFVDDSYCNSQGTKPSGETQICNINSCLAIDGVCGSVNGTTISTQPSLNLCNTGTPTPVSGSGPWTWTWNCNGSGVGATNASCSANKTAPSPVNGVCDTTQYACTIGTPKNQNAGSCGGSSTWNCSGVDGGVDSPVCSKLNPVCPSVGPYSYSTWGLCSVSCGGGIQTRTETCSHGTCNNQQPTQQTCNPQACVNYCILDATLDCEL